VKFLFYGIFCLAAAFGCKKDPEIKNNFKTKNVVIISIDGPRWSETWGGSSRANIPHRQELLSKGAVLFNNFYNDGPTYTNAGHTAMITGVYQSINNSGNESPQQPNIFQHWLKMTGEDKNKAWLISTKDKIAALGNCLNPSWMGKYLPSTDCGINGPGSGYREDSITYAHAVQIFTTYHPAIALVHFKEPDASGHSGIWNSYIEGLRSSDRYAVQFWQFLENDPYYAGNTTIFITNDHGRHLDGIQDGFVNHGDNCIGCRHIELLATGPDFKKGCQFNSARQLRDLAPTIALLLGFKMNEADGEVITELFK
jgi:hypothetical protein